MTFAEWWFWVIWPIVVALVIGYGGIWLGRQHSR
jgi:hypothetical protein